MSDVRNAIENALTAMAPLLATATISTSSVAASTVITTSAAHGLATGVYVQIAGHNSTPTINGIYKITVISTTKFSIPIAVTVAGSGGTATAQLSAWENVDFVPVTGIPYQTCSIVLGKPANTEMGASFFEVGFAQIDCVYPSQTGPNAAEARAAAIRTAFKRGNTFASNGVTVMVTGTPQIMNGYPSPGCWVLPVRIPFQAQITV